MPGNCQCPENCSSLCVQSGKKNSPPPTTGRWPMSLMFLPAKTCFFSRNQKIPLTATQQNSGHETSLNPQVSQGQNHPRVSKIPDRTFFRLQFRSSASCPLSVVPKIKKLVKPTSKRKKKNILKSGQVQTILLKPALTNSSSFVRYKPRVTLTGFATSRTGRACRLYPFNR